MKKLLIFVIAIAFMAGVSHAANFASIGYIDVQKVFKEYKETTKAQGDLSKQEESFKKEFEDSQAELAKAEKDGKKPEELDKMKKDLEDKLAPKRETLLKLNAELTGKLQQDILVAVQKVAKKVGIDVVFDKQVVITGGMDLTDMVITAVNK
ncbi:MAG TPA: OmpH family outer membrane protein [Candidatus Sulfotelmatobacter sp.]|nr:OmpH family outer membrane protein [Candidatus Sulfotelmatobacter sp.]